MSARESESGRMQGAYFIAMLHLLPDFTAFKAECTDAALCSMRLAAIPAVSFATNKRLENVAQLSLAGLSIATANQHDNPTGWIFAVRLGFEKADCNPSKISLADKVSELSSQ